MEFTASWSCGTSEMLTRTQEPALRSTYHENGHRSGADGVGTGVVGLEVAPRDRVRPHQHRILQGCDVVRRSRDDLRTSLAQTL